MQSFQFRSVGAGAISLAILLVGMLGAGFAAQPALAQDVTPDYDPAILDGCLAQSQGQGYRARATCIGVGADACLMTDAGNSTVGVGSCFHAEWMDWDARLNATYQALLVTQGELAEDIAAYSDRLPSPVETMRDMQIAWIAYRDAACEWEYAQWGGGTGGGPASGACMMRLTALQVLLLEEKQY